MKAVHAEESDEVRSAWQRWLAGDGDGRLDVTFRIARPDGETRWIHSRGTLIRDDQGKAYRASGIFEDVDRRKARAGRVCEGTDGARSRVAVADAAARGGEIASSCSRCF